MSLNASIEVTGVKDALRELNNLDKQARREVTRQFREIMQPTLRDAQSLLPGSAPMSGWERYWNPREGLQRASEGKGILPWASNNRRSIEAYVSGSRPKEIGGVTRGLAAFGVRWKGPNAVLFDMAQNSQTPQGRQMVETLQARFGSPSRVMWKAFERTDDQVNREIEKLIEGVMRAVGRKVKVGA